MVSYDTSQKGRSFQVMKHWIGRVRNRSQFSDSVEMLITTVINACSWVRKVVDGQNLIIYTLEELLSTPTLGDEERTPVWTLREFLDGEPYMYELCYDLRPVFEVPKDWDDRNRMPFPMKQAYHKMILHEKLVLAKPLLTSEQRAAFDRRFEQYERDLQRLRDQCTRESALVPYVPSTRLNPTPAPEVPVHQPELRSLDWFDLLFLREISAVVSVSGVFILWSLR